MNVAANQLANVALSALPRRPGISRESFERALIRDYPGMILLLLRHARDPHLAADILQDAIVTTLTKLDQGVVAPTPLIAGYVFRTAMNHLHNHWRTERSRIGSGAAKNEQISDIASPEDQLRREANARAVRRVLHALGSSRDREVLVRFYLHEESKQEICAALGLGDIDFKRVVFRARGRMRRQLEGAGMSRADLFSFLTIASLLTLVR